MTNLTFPADAVPRPISNRAREIAAACAAEQKSPEKAEQVRRNLLAVLALHDYLRFPGGYALDLEKSDCWNPVLRRLSDVADLWVSGIGRLECCVFEPEAESCAVPEEAQDDRVGYVAIEFREATAWFLGFMPAMDSDQPLETLQRSQLLSMDELGAFLHRLSRFAEKVPDACAEYNYSEPWTPEERLEIAALLERIYRTESPIWWVRMADREISDWLRARNELESESSPIENSPTRELATRSGDRIDSDSESILRQVLREIFDCLEDELDEDNEEVG
jgi:Protein of unknown function (DUF1822)